MNVLSQLILVVFMRKNPQWFNAVLRLIGDEIAVSCSLFMLQNNRL